MLFQKYLYLFFIIVLVLSLKVEAQNDFSGGVSADRFSGYSFLPSQSTFSQPSEKIVLHERLVDTLYRVGPGDIFKFVFDDYSKTETVSAEGRINIGNGTLIDIYGLRLDSVNLLLCKEILKNQKLERCKSTLQSPRDFMVRIAGEVKKPGMYQISAQQNVFEAIQKSNGFTQSANTNAVYIINEINKDTSVVEIGKSLLNNCYGCIPFVSPFTTIYVKKINKVKEGIFVSYGQHTKTLPLKQETILNVLKIFFDYDFSIPFTRGVVKRANGVFEIIQMQDLGNLLYTGDSFYLSDAEEKVFVGGAVAKPGFQKYTSGWRVIDYVGAAGIDIEAERQLYVYKMKNFKKNTLITDLNQIGNANEFYYVDQSKLNKLNKLVTIILPILNTIILSITLLATTNK